MYEGKFYQTEVDWQPSADEATMHTSTVMMGHHAEYAKDGWTPKSFVAIPSYGVCVDVEESDGLADSLCAFGAPRALATKAASTYLEWEADLEAKWEQDHYH